MKLFEIACFNRFSELNCACIVAADSKENAKIIPKCENPTGGKVDDPSAYEIKTVKDKDGNAYRVLLLEDLSGCGGCCIDCGKMAQEKTDDLRLIRKQTEVRCDEPGCDWSLCVNPENVLEWHNKPCPRCNRGVIINDNEAELFRQILAISEPDTGEESIVNLTIDSAMLRNVKKDG